MGKIGLQLKANMENVTNLIPNGDDYRWYLKLRCMNCGEETEKWQYIIALEKIPMKGSRGEANLVSKCKLCGRENSVDIIKDSLTAYSSKDESFQTVISFECRGLEPFDFSPRGNFIAEGLESDTKFTDINLEQKEWADYDEKAKVCVGIYDLEHRFVKL